MKRLLLILYVIVHCILISGETSCHAGGNFANAISGISPGIGAFRVRVFFHIIRTSNGTGAYCFSSNNIQSCIQRLNNDYYFATMSDITFDYAGMDYIDNTDFYNITSYDSFEAQNLFNTNRHPDAIDVYLLPTESSIAGYANGIPGTALAVGGNYYGMALGSSSVLSHEIGHCLGLFHTFHGGTDEPYGLIDYVHSNSLIRGDYVADTEADPFRLYDQIVACAWFNTTYTDANGLLYMPDVSQIMADVPSECMNTLTFGQGNRIRTHITSQQSLQDRLTQRVAFVQNRQFAGNGEEIIMANDSIIAGYNVTSGTNGNVVIPSGGNVTFQAGKKLYFRPGFKVNLGANFLAKVDALPMLNRSNLPTKYASSDDYIPFLGNTSWTTIYHNMNDSHAWAYVSQYVGDSIINEKHYKMIKHYYLSMENPTLFPTNEPSLIYEDVNNRRVYAYDNYYDTDILMYDFSIQVGDRFPHDITAPESWSDFVLVDISPIENSGYTRKQYTFVHESDTIVWIEGIGNYNCFFSPQFVKNDAMRVLCVHKDDKTIYDTGSFSGWSCGDVDQTLDDLLATESVHVIPIDSPSAIKFIGNDNQIYIIRNNRTYTLTGKSVR